MKRRASSERRGEGIKQFFRVRPLQCPFRKFLVPALHHVALRFGPSRLRRFTLRRLRRIGGGTYRRPHLSAPTESLFRLCQSNADYDVNDAALSYMRKRALAGPVTALSKTAANIRQLERRGGYPGLTCKP